MKKHVGLVLGLAFATQAHAQTAQDILKASPDSVLTYGMNYSQNRFSPLDKIKTTNVRKLVPAWSYSLNNNTGEEAQPIIFDGKAYITSQNKTVALDALTGREIWNTPVEYPPATTRVVCCGIINRGAAIYDGKLFRTTLDARVIALDINTGKEVWSAKSGDAKDGIAMTGAPIIANGVLITGMAGAEYGSRGYVEAYDPQTGKQLWRFYTVPRPGDKGADTWPENAANASGGSTWTTGTYDPDMDVIFWGIGNPAPWNPLLRPGDNLYTNSIVALKPKTGEVVWHYQMSPTDPFDHDNITSIITADLNVEGKPTKALIQVARNGFVYILDRTNGKLLSANPYVKVTWAKGIDLATGRPIWTDATKKALTLTDEIETWPSNSGGTNWFPYSYDPRKQIAYVNTLDFGMKYQPAPIEEIRNLKPGQGHRGVKITKLYDDDARGHLRAIDPFTGKAKWEIPFKSPNWAGTLVTAGGLVFTGTLTGEMIAVDADQGKILWSFQTPSGIIGQPVTWEKDGKQYVTVTSGTGGVYVMNTPDPNLKHVPAGGNVFTFKLMED
jgi:alcohol dehydrogenase (cytochrome c)